MKEVEPVIPKFLPDSHILYYSDFREAQSFSTARHYLQTPRMVFIHWISSALPPILVQMVVFRWCRRLSSACAVTAVWGCSPARKYGNLESGSAGCFSGMPVIETRWCFMGWKLVPARVPCKDSPLPLLCFLMPVQDDAAQSQACSSVLSSPTPARPMTWELPVSWPFAQCITYRCSFW